MKIFLSQCTAELKRTIRNPYFLFFSVAMPVVFYFIFTSVMDGNQIIDGVKWKAYYLISMTIFSVIGSSISSLGIRIAQERTQGFMKQLQATPLPNWMYLTAKMFAQSLINLGIILFLFLIGYVVKDIELTTSQWIISGLWIWIGALPFLTLGVLIGCSKNTEIAQVLSNIIHLGLAILGGLWMPLASLPIIAQRIGEWLPSYLYGKGAWSILAGETIIVYDIVILILYLLFFMVLSVYISKRQEAIA